MSQPAQSPRVVSVAAGVEHTDRTFYDSFGNVHRSRLDIDGDVLTWRGDRTGARSR